jgi:hypothetical protein
MRIDSSSPIGGAGPIGGSNSPKEAMQQFMNNFFDRINSTTQPTLTNSQVVGMCEMFVSFSTSMGVPFNSNFSSDFGSLISQLQNNTNQPLSTIFSSSNQTMLMNDLNSTILGQANPAALNNEISSIIGDNPDDLLGELTALMCIPGLDNNSDIQKAIGSIGQPSSFKDIGQALTDAAAAVNALFNQF